MFIGLVLLMIVGYVLDGLALQFLWGWFMVPSLNLPVISFVQAIGISIVIGYLTHQYIHLRDEYEWELIVYTIMSPIITLTVGWIVHLFV